MTEQNGESFDQGQKQSVVINDFVCSNQFDKIKLYIIMNSHYDRKMF